MRLLIILSALISTACMPAVYRNSSGQSVPNYVELQCEQYRLVALAGRSDLPSMVNAEIEKRNCYRLNDFYQVAN
jgi:hypothetical protein